ncbi:MAG: hypothetical protein COS35_07395, partial [Zetaproteobacteria bacterium CG02_land_8_20_14_3_00_50_9]
MNKAIHFRDDALPLMKPRFNGVKLAVRMKHSIHLLDEELFNAFDSDATAHSCGDVFIFCEAGDKSGAMHRCRAADGKRECGDVFDHGYAPCVGGLDQQAGIAHAAAIGGDGVEALVAGDAGDLGAAHAGSRAFADLFPVWAQEIERGSFAILERHQLGFHRPERFDELPFPGESLLAGEAHHGKGE